MQLYTRICIILLMCIPLSSVAAGIGTVTEQLNSPADIIRQTTKLVANKGTGIEMNDSVRTQQGKVGITFEDNTRVQVNENSKLVIDDFVYDPKAKTGKIAMKMALGTVRYASGAIAHNSPSGVSINTPSATISVRGTDFTATVDELGQSTVILLPSCPDNQNKSRTAQDIERDCVTGSIIVESDVGQVILTQPFQATRVESRGLMPVKPVILRLSEDAIGNMLMLSPPRELSREDQQTKMRLEMKNALDMDFLKEQGLVNALDAQAQELFQDKLSRNFLDQDFLANVLDILDAQMKAQLNLLNTTSNKLLPDYVALTGIIVEIDEPKLTLSRDNGSDVMSVTVSTSQNTTIYMNQSNMEFKNRVNSGGGTTITLTQK